MLRYGREFLTVELFRQQWLDGLVAVASAVHITLVNELDGCWVLVKGSEDERDVLVGAALFRSEDEFEVTGRATARRATEHDITPTTSTMVRSIVRLPAGVHRKPLNPRAVVKNSGWQEVCALREHYVDLETRPSGPKANLLRFSWNSMFSTKSDI